MNTLTCSHCGQPTVMAICLGCRQRAAICTCRPVSSRPVWVRNLVAKDMTRAAA